MENQKDINCVITDLDNTIWDWLSMWYNSFDPYLKRISNEFNVKQDKLLDDFRILHQKYGSTEASFLYNELQSLSIEQKKKINQPSGKKKSIIHEYNHSKKHGLFLYEGVLETLKYLKEKDVLLIGFTESNDFFTKYRIKQLNLDGLFDVIYAPIAFELPDTFDRFYPKGYWEPEITEFRYLSPNITKPAPQILNIIIKDFKVEKEHCIYVGDKVEKDIFMANEANITSVFAAYGNVTTSKEYVLLRKVTHWNDEDVQREKLAENLKENIFKANYTLESSFSELLKLFNFSSFNINLNKKNQEVVLEMWKKAIDVQQHFNDIELRIRNFALTAFTFLVAAIGYIEKEDLAVRLANGYEIPYSMIMAFLGFIIIWAFFYMDKYWYHKLLNGAVKQAVYIEKRWEKIYPEITLSTKIGDASPHKFLFWTVHSKHKYRFFYGCLFAVLIIGIIALFVLNNWDMLFCVDN